MKNLYDILQEGILGNVDDVMQDGDKEVERLSTFGARFHFDRAVCGSRSSEVLSLKTLKKLTKDMDYMSTGIKNGVFNRMDGPKDKIKMFANWLDHIKFSDLGITDTTDTGDKLRREFTEKFRKYCDENEVFNNKGRISMWVVSEAATHGDKKRFEIIVSRDDKISSMHVFRLYYTAV